MTLSKRTRFEIFKRDNFTCQYCGSRPPDVVLEVDHIHPRSKGGDNDTINLITACADCNRGKSDRVLREMTVRPDADLKYLESQQEIAEARRYIASRDEGRVLQERLIGLLGDTWDEQIGYKQPDHGTWVRWLKFASPEQIEEAICKLGSKLSRQYGFRLNCGADHYISGILKRMVAEDGDGGEV